MSANPQSVCRVFPRVSAASELRAVRSRCGVRPLSDACGRRKGGSYAHSRDDRGSEGGSGSEGASCAYAGTDLSWVNARRSSS